MGAWGYKALESDEGLDVAGFLQDYIENQINSNHLLLTDIIKAMKNDGFFGETFNDIDFFYDVSVMALAEIYITYLDTGYFLSDESKCGNVQSLTLTADEDALIFIIRYLTDIRDEMPDKHGSREIVELWRESKSWHAWQSNLNNLILRIEQEISHLH